jgi:hypothetical protein
MAWNIMKLSLWAHLKPAAPLHNFRAESSVCMFMALGCSHSRSEWRSLQNAELILSIFLSTLVLRHVVWRFSLAHGKALRVSTDAKRHTSRHLHTYNEQFFVTKGNWWFNWLTSYYYTYLISYTYQSKFHISFISYITASTALCWALTFSSVP